MAPKKKKKCAESAAGHTTGSTAGSAGGGGGGGGGDSFMECDEFDTSLDTKTQSDSKISYRTGSVIHYTSPSAAAAAVSDGGIQTRSAKRKAETAVNAMSVVKTAGAGRQRSPLLSASSNHLYRTTRLN